MKPNIKKLPCFKQVADVIGVKQANIELWKVVHCEDVLTSRWRRLFEGALQYSFPWQLSPQKLKFWENITLGINPYTGEKV